MSKAVNAILIVGVVVGFVLVTGMFLTDQFKTTAPSQSLGWDLDDFSKVGVGVADNKIVLSTDCHRLDIFTSESQVLSIQEGLTHEGVERPLTHDLMADSLEFFDVGVVMAKVVSLDGGTYNARLILRNESSVLDIDSRPSDAIAVAVRAGAPVYVKDSLLEEQGENTC